MLDFLMIFSNILAISIVFLFVKSLLYLKQYRTKLGFDNVFITQTFKRFDHDCKTKGQISVLPLLGREVRHFIFTNSKAPSVPERSKLTSSFITITFHILISMLIIWFDCIMIYVLELLQKYEDVAFTVEGVETVYVAVAENGTFSDIIHYMVNNLNSTTYNVDFNFTNCRPNPSFSNIAYNYAIISLYAIVLLLTTLQGYGFRLRRRIASSFYPKQEYARVIYMHERLIHRREMFYDWMEDHVLKHRKEYEVRKKVTLLGGLAHRYPGFERCCGCLLPHRRSCNCCGLLKTWGIAFEECSNSECRSVFCEECFGFMKSKCIMCDAAHEVRIRRPKYPDSQKSVKKRFMAELSDFLRGNKRNSDSPTEIES